MSRSYRKKPFMAISGNHSAKRDKQLAHRGERRKHAHCIRMALKADQIDNYMPPLRRECSWNNTYSWSRDGKQHFQQPTQRDWQDYLNGEDTWPPRWYVDMMRK